MKFLFVLLLFVASSSWAEEFILRDSDCKLLAPVVLATGYGDQVRVSEGDKSESTCVVVGTEASCHYKNLSTGKNRGGPTKFEVIDLGGVQSWKSTPSGNISVLIDEEGKRFIYGMTTTLLEARTLLNKQCVGKIVHQLK
jgi:hypothetical protein